MKRLVTIILSLISAIGFAFAFTGCKDENTSDNEDVDVRIFDLRYAYEAGYVDEFDLKSIACRQYECYGIEENPYAGTFTQSTHISAKEERFFKNKFSEWYNWNLRAADNIEPSDVEIINYYGNYDGNVVAELNFKSASHIQQIDGVKFCHKDNLPIYVMHYVEYDSDSLLIEGRIQTLENAYERGWLTEDDLKSIACGYYDYMKYEENPYKGLYEKPTEKLSREMKTQLKISYLAQEIKTSTKCLDDAQITKYFGTYNGNVVAVMDYTGGCVYPNFSIDPAREVGGVLFKNYSWCAIYIFHPYANDIQTK